MTASTEQYERWLGEQLTLLPDDLDYKHAQMRKGLFPFLRATFYRWLEVWPHVCSDLAQAPTVLAVGDLHVENFGTWRDAEGRLVWGINDFDEAYELAFTMDLVRLATSAVIAIAENQLKISDKSACEAILAGYEEALKSGGQAFVLEERHGWLRDIAYSEFRTPDRFWDKMTALPTATHLSSAAAAVLKRALPENGNAHRIAVRRAGLGSLGRERYVALMDWRGGMVAREVKSLAPSVCVWAGYGDRSTIRYNEMLKRAVRALDPFVTVEAKWVIRRLAPHCTKIDIDAMPGEKHEAKLLHAMGAEVGNVHLGTADARTVRAYMATLPAGWLLRFAREMRDATANDFEAFRATG